MTRRISPIAWRHVNLYGRYEFKSEGALISDDELLIHLERNFTLNEQMELNFNEDQGKASSF